jgi:hypothetical protein
MRFACWINKATDTHSEYVILIAFPRRRGLNVLFIGTFPVLFYVFFASNTHRSQQTDFTQALLPTDDTLSHSPLEADDHLEGQNTSCLSDVSRLIIVFKTPSLILT